MDTSTSIAADEVDAKRLRRDMVPQLREALPLVEPVLHAMLTVPRHQFVPEAELANAYHLHSTVVTKRDESGAPVSSASAPWVVALMLADADLPPGQRVCRQICYYSTHVVASAETTAAPIGRTLEGRSPPTQPLR